MVYIPMVGGGSASPLCAAGLLRTLCSTSTNCSASGGLDAPVAFSDANGTHHVLFNAYNARGLPNVISMDWPTGARTPMSHVIAAAGSPIPGRALKFEAFSGLAGEAASGQVGFVAFANLSQGLDEFKGIYLVRRPGESVRKVADTLDFLPGPHALHFRTLSAPAMYSDPIQRGTRVVFSGSDALGGGREVIMRWSETTGKTETLVDSALVPLRGLDAPQLSVPSNSSRRRWLFFRADETSAAPPAPTSATSATSATAALRLSPRGMSGGAPSARPAILALELMDDERQAASGPRVLVGVTTPVPGSAPPQTFVLLGGPVAMGAASVIFVGEGSSGSQGIYAADLAAGGPPTLRRLVDTTSPLPGGGSPTGFPHAPAAASNGLVVFYASSAAQSGLYALDGSLAAGRLGGVPTTAPRIVATTGRVMAEEKGAAAAAAAVAAAGRAEVAAAEKGQVAAAERAAEVVAQEAEVTLVESDGGGGRTAEGPAQHRAVPWASWEVQQHSTAPVYGHIKAVATLANSHLVYLIARFNGFDGRCLAFYGSTDSDDAIYTIGVDR